MSDLEEKKYKLERWKVILLTIAAFSTFLTFFIPFVNQREQQMDQIFSETLQRLSDVNPAVRASGAIDLVNLYHYRRFFRLGSSPYKNRCIFLLKNSLKIKGEEEIVREAMLLALLEINPEAMNTKKLKGIDLSGLDLLGINFGASDLSFSNLSGASNQETAWLVDSFCDPNRSYSVSFEFADLTGANMADTKFMMANFEGAILEGTNMSGSRLWRGTDLRNAVLLRTNLTNADWKGPDKYGVNLEGATIDGAILIGTNLSHTRLNGAIFRNITKWDQRTNFEGAECQGTQFDTSSDFYKWGQSRFPNCFK